MPVAIPSVLSVHFPTSIKLRITFGKFCESCSLCLETSLPLPASPVGSLPYIHDTPYHRRRVKTEMVAIPVEITIAANVS